MNNNLAYSYPPMAYQPPLRTGYQPTPATVTQLTDWLRSRSQGEQQTTQPLNQFSQQGTGQVVPTPQVVQDYHQYLQTLQNQATSQIQHSHPFTANSGQLGNSQPATQQINANAVNAAYHYKTAENQELYKAIAYLAPIANAYPYKQAENEHLQQALNALIPIANAYPYKQAEANELKNALLALDPILRAYPLREAENRELWQAVNYLTQIVNETMQYQQLLINSDWLINHLFALLGQSVTQEQLANLSANFVSLMDKLGISQQYQQQQQQQVQQPQIPLPVASDGLPQRANPLDVWRNAIQSGNAWAALSQARRVGVI